MATPTIRCYDEATKLKPDYIEAWNNKGLAYMGKYSYGENKRFDYEDAAKCFEKALEYTEKDNNGMISKQDFADIYNNLGITSYELGDYEKSIKCFEKALQIDSQFKFADENKVIIIQELGKKRKIV